MAESTLPAVDDETKGMLENQVKKGKPRKFILICKGVEIKTLIVFKKGPYGVKITAAKKAGFKGEVYSGVVTGQGISLTFQLPATDEVLEAMKAEGNVCADEKEPCKIARLREFLQEEADFKSKPEFQFVKTVDAIARVTEDDEVQGSLETGLTKERLTEGLKKTKPFIEKALAAAPARKDEVMSAVALVKQLIGEGKFEEAQTAMLQLGGLLREIIKAAGPQPQATAPTQPLEGPPTEKQTKKSQWDALLKELTPKLRAFTQYRIGDYKKLGDILKQAQEAKPNDLDQAIEYLKQCGALVNEIEVKHKRDYEKVRDENAKRFDNSQKHEPIKDFIAAGRTDAEKMAGELNFSGAVGRLRELIELIHGESSKIEQEFNTIYDDVIFKELEFERDPNDARDAVQKYLKDWDLVAAAAEVKQFKTQMDRSKRVGFSDLGEVEKRAQDAKLQNAQHSRNTAMAVIAAKRLIDEDGNLRLDADLLSDLAFTPAHHLAGVIEEIERSGLGDLPQTVHALQILKRLQTDENVRNALNAVAAPPEQDSTAAHIIRATLGLKKDAVVSDADARRAALSALMFQARQGDVGSCFVTATAVQVQRNNPEKFLADIQEMFATGQLTRTIQHGGGDYTVESPFNKEMLVSNLEKKTTVPRTDSNLHLAPDMVASLDFLDVDPNDREEAIQDATQDLRAKEAINKSLKELDGWLDPADQSEDIRDEALAELRSDRSLSIREALKRAFDNLGIDVQPTSRNGCARELGHTDMDAYAKSEGFKNYKDLEKKSGPRVQDAYAQSLGYSDEREWRLDTGLAKCDSFDDPTGSDAFSPQDILAQVVENLVPEDERKSATKGANDAFLAQQDNRLMRAWEYTIATMVERNPAQNSYGDKMNEGLCVAMANKVIEIAEDYIKTLGSVPAKQQEAIARLCMDVLTKFAEQQKKQSKSQYDPSVKTAKQSVAKDGHSSSGGYSLYNGDKRIDSETAFNEMLEDIMNQALTEFDKNGAWSKAGKDLGRKFATDLLKYMKTKEFRDNCTANNPCTDKDKLASPWTYSEGGDEAPLVQFYFDSPTPLKVASSKGYEYEAEIDDGTGKKTKVKRSGNTPEGVTHFLLEQLKKMNVGDRMDPNNAESAGVRVRTLPVHSFTLKPGTPAMLGILNGEKDSATVIEEMKKSEKKKNEQRRNSEFPLNDPLDGPLLKVMEKATSHWSARSVGTVREKTKQRLKALNKKTITIAELQAEINRVIEVDYASQTPEWQTKVKADNDARLAVGMLESIVPRDEFEPLIDTALDKLKVADDKRAGVAKSALAALNGDAADKADIEKAVQEALKQANVEMDPKRIATALNEPRGLVIADTNWGNGQHMTQFSMMVNPLTDELELWEMNEDGTNPRRADQDKWIKNADCWQVFSDASEYSGVTGDDAWETRRADLRKKVMDCVSKRQGNIGMMQSVLEIADQKFADGNQAAGEKALDRLDTLLKRAAKLTTNVEEATKALDQFKKAVEKVAIDEAKEAAKFVDSLIKEVKVLRDENSIADFASRRKSDLELLKEGKQHLGVDVDLVTILSKA